MSKLVIALTTGLAAVAAATAALAGTWPAPSPHQRAGAAVGPPVRVSGRWSIVVRRSGRVVRRVRFENALLPSGVLPSLMAGTAVAGNWRINLVENRPGSTATPLPLAATVHLESPAVRLRGSRTIDTAGTIVTVGTAVAICGGSVTPDSCRQSTTASYEPFTAKTGLSVPVQAGDTVGATVTLTAGNPTNFTNFDTVVSNLLVGSRVLRAWNLKASRVPHTSSEGFLPATTTVTTTATTLVVQGTGFTTDNDVSINADHILNAGDFFAQGVFCSDTACSSPPTAIIATYYHPGGGNDLHANQQWRFTWTLTFS
jgi:hypothetical protein